MPRPALCLWLLAFALAFVPGPTSAAKSPSSEESVESEENLSIENVSRPKHDSIEDDSSEEYISQPPQGQENLRRDVAGTQVIRVFIRNKNDERKFDNLRRRTYYELVHRTTSDVDILVTPSTVQETKDSLRAANLDYKILIEDVQKKIEAENPKLTPEEQELVGRQGHKLTFEHYHRVEDQHGYLDYLKETYKEFVSLENIGTSHEGRELRVLKISSGYQNASAIWIDGGIHAREWISSATVLHITRELTEYRDNLPEEMKKIDFYIMPMVNPDGYEYTHSGGWNRMWRKNRAPAYGCPGVDLNRNYGYKWGGKGTSNSKCSDIYRGSGPNSEPETKTVTNYIRSKSPKIQGFLTFHSYGQYILYPWGYDKKVPPDYQDLQRVGDNAARKIKESQGVNYKVGNSASLLYPAAGAADDWAKAQHIKYTYTVELRDEGENGFILPASEINACGKDGFEVVKAVAEALVQSPPYVP